MMMMLVLSQITKKKDVSIYLDRSTAERYNSSKNKFFDAFRLALRYYKFSEGETQQHSSNKEGFILKVMPVLN